MTDNPQTIEVRAVLRRFQEYYTRRDPALADECLDLFAQEEGVELIGTGGVRPGLDEWYLDRDGVRKLLVDDWQTWGDLALDVAGARITCRGEVAWLACAGTVSMRIERDQCLRDYLAGLPARAEQPGRAPADTLLYILRGGINTLYQFEMGEQFVWPLRFSAVLVHTPQGWKFHQMQFSHPNAFFPDLRVVGGEVRG